MDSIYNFVYNETQNINVAQVNMIIKLYKHTSIVTVFVCKTGWIS